MLKFRFAEKGDVDIYFNWANDPVVRANSYIPYEINYEDHIKWFLSKIASDNSQMYLFLNEQDIPVGQVRIDRNTDETIIGISIPQEFRGQSLASQMLIIACQDYLNKYPGEQITAYIKLNNESSLRSFRKAGFIVLGKKPVHNIESYVLAKTL